MIRLPQQVPADKPPHLRPVHPCPQAAERVADSTAPSAAAPGSYGNRTYDRMELDATVFYPRILPQPPMDGKRTGRLDQGHCVIGDVVPKGEATALPPPIPLANSGVWCARDGISAGMQRHPRPTKRPHGDNAMTLPVRSDFGFQLESNCTRRGESVTRPLEAGKPWATHRIAPTGSARQSRSRPAGSADHFQHPSEVTARKQTECQNSDMAGNSGGSHRSSPKALIVLMMRGR